MTLARWLALAASPSFAMMAVASFVAGDRASDALCSASGIRTFGGMTTMYGLMCLVHAQPWLCLLEAARPCFSASAALDLED